MSSFPYSYYRCPCADISLPDPALSTEDPNDASSNAEEENAFNPHDARSNFSLYPLEHLMWCESCHEIRCERCVIEEIVCWFCPGCGFEVASSMVKSEGNRCTRNCYNCPSCTAGLFVNSLDVEGAAAPWILVCEHCDWTSLDIGITFDKPNNIHGQLAKILGKTRSKIMRMLDDDPNEKTQSPKPLQSDPDAKFERLMAFYKSEMNRESPANNNPFLSSPGGTPDYSSPGKFARIMSLYTNTGNYGKKANTKSQPMRGAENTSEGLSVVDHIADEETIDRIRDGGLISLTNTEQRMNQPHNPRFQSEMLPQATLLSTKNSRRCRTCRHILVKPEAKVSSTRYRIKLIALNHIPSIAIKPFPSSLPQQSGNKSTDPAAGVSATSIPAFSWNNLPINKPFQLLLTLSNPLFEEIRVTLATPSVTPGRFGHKVTILCPQFTLGANADIWDEALGLNNNSGSGGSSTTDPSRRSSKLLVPVSKAGSSSTGKSGVEEEARIAEAGKIWDRGRNWTTVVLEVICSRIDMEIQSSTTTTGPVKPSSTTTTSIPATDLAEDEDTLQIPLFVRLEYEQQQQQQQQQAKSSTNPTTAGGTLATSSKSIGNDTAPETGKVSREVAYWVALGVGRVSRSGGGV